MNKPFLRSLGELEILIQQPDITERWSIIHRLSWATFLFTQANPKEAHSLEMDLIAFASWCTHQEILATGIHPARTWVDSLEAEKWLNRFFQWLGARAHVYDFVSGKICPDQSGTAPAVARASFFGWLVRNMSCLEDAVELAEYVGALRQRQGTAEDKAYAKWAGKTTLPRWDHPEIDCWLICSWPIVRNYRWNYRDIWRVACLRFGADLSSIRGPIGENSRAMAVQCKRLGLRLAAGAAFHKEEPPMANLAMVVPFKTSAMLPFCSGKSGS